MCIRDRDEYASTRQETPGIEAPAKKVHMISEKIEAPAPAEEPAEPSAEGAETQNSAQSVDSSPADISGDGPENAPPHGN